MAISRTILKVLGLATEKMADPNLFTLIDLLLTLGVILLVKKLTAGVLQGTEFTESMQVEWLGEQFEIEIRPLNNTEAGEVQALMQEGITVKGKPGRNGKMERQMDFDTKANLLGRNKSDVKAVALGTTDKSLTEKVIENEFPPKLVKEIGQRIKEITGIEIEKQGESLEAFNEGKENPSNENGEQ